MRSRDDNERTHKIVPVLILTAAMLTGCMAETLTQIPLSVTLGEGATCGDIKIEVLMESKQALEQRDVGKPQISAPLSVPLGGL